jgi:hypothetical protein
VVIGIKWLILRLVILSAAKDLYRWAERFFTAFRMTAALSIHQDLAAVRIMQVNAKTACGK